MAVVAARERDHPVAPGGAARQAQRRHRRLGPGRDESHRLDGRHRIDDLGGELDLALGRRAEARPAKGRLAHGLDRLCIRVPEDERAPRLHPVAVRPAVGRLEVRAPPARDEERLVEPDGAHRAHRRVDAARNQLLGAVPA